MSKPKRSAASLKIVVIRAPRCPGQYEARLDGDDRVLCVSRTPFFSAARKLLAGGHDPSLILVMRHAGSDTESLRATLGAAATLTVEETNYGPKLRRWKPISTLAVAPTIAPDKRAATTLGKRPQRRPYTPTRGISKRQQPSRQATAGSGRLIN